jgi:uncharacterized membrane protein HdeD (DUF308 family)
MSPVTTGRPDGLCFPQEAQYPHRTQALQRATPTPPEPRTPRHPGRWLTGLLLGLLLGLPAAAASLSGAPRPATPALPGDPGLWYASPPQPPALDLYFFWSPRCPHCRQARPQVEALAATHPWLRLHSLSIDGPPEHRQRFAELAALTGEPPRSVPSFYWCGRGRAGWAGPASATALERDLADCYRQLYGTAPPGGAAGPEAATAAGAELPVLGHLTPGDYALPLLTLLLAGVDAFNPCAFFVLLFLLSLLANTRSRPRMLLVGGIFVSVSGLVYFLFMAAWLSLFQLLGSLSWVTLGAGTLALVMGGLNVKDYFRFRQGPSLSLSEAQRGRLFARMRRLLEAGRLPALAAGATLLAVAANGYELLCTAGFPMVYTRTLTLHDLSPAGYYGYLALYNLIYIIPLLLIVLGFVYALGRRKLTQAEGQWLKLLSGMMMLTLGSLLLLAPERLSSPWVALGTVAAALAATSAVAALTRLRQRRR